MHSWKHIGNTLFVVAVMGTMTAIAYVNREKYVPLYEIVTTFLGMDKPCSKPIVYYIEEFNPKFGQTREEFENNLQKASSIWNNAYGKELFRYSREEADKMFDLSKRKLQVNLIYDQRQATTEQLKAIGSTIDSNKDSYENQKARYDTLKSEYESKRQILESMIKQYQSDKSNRSNVQAINKATQELNIIVNELNSLGATLNSMNKDINQKIYKWNQISLTNGPEFQEGEYVLDEKGQRINIYEYKDYNKLIRVLAHEFGHALGIDHVDGQNSIMNAYNTESNTNLSQNDINALKAICEAK